MFCNKSSRPATLVKIRRTSLTRLTLNILFYFILFYFTSVNVRRFFQKRIFRERFEPTCEVLDPISRNPGVHFRPFCFPLENPLPLYPRMLLPFECIRICSPSRETERESVVSFLSTTTRRGSARASA